MRRCLRAFLVGLITLSLLSGPAHACWRSRQARHCRPAAVACPPPVWRECCDPCGITEVVVWSHCPPAPACCGEGGVVIDDWQVGVVVADGTIVAEAVDSVVETVIDTTIGPPPVAESQPTPAPGDRAPIVATEPPAAGLAPAVAPPALAPAGEAGGVQTTSIEEPLSIPAAPAPSTEPPSAAPTAGSVLADGAEMPKPAGEAGPPGTPADLTPPTEPPFAEPVTPAIEEPEMATEETPPSDGSEPADEPAADAAPAVEPPMADEVSPETPAPAEPETSEPEPAMEPEQEPETAPEEGNIFEELDAEGGDAAPAGEAEEMTEEPVADEPEEPAADPFGDSDGDAAEPAAEPEMTEEEPAAVPDDGGGEPADPFASGEPSRRWIDATGTASMVATLIEVGADGRCVLETRGRRIAVPIDNLSGHDRDYVRQAGVRLAKLRADKARDTAAAAPAPTDTAGL